MAVEGSLDLFSLPEILQMISQQSKTGILTIQGQQDIVAVSFLAGRIVAADSLAHTVEDGLSKVLVSEGLIGAAEFARANAENQARGGRLLDLLVERGHLTRQQLLGALRLQTIRQLEALLRWEEGDFKFYGGDEVSYEEGFEPISVEDLLLRTLADFLGPTPPAAKRALPPSKPAQAAPVPPRASLAGWAPAARDAPTGASQPRRAAGQPRPESAELWLPQVPELPEVSLPEARAAQSRGSPPPAAALAAPGGVAASPPEPLPWPAAVMSPPPPPNQGPGKTPLLAASPPAAGAGGRAAGGAAAAPGWAAAIGAFSPAAFSPAVAGLAAPTPAATPLIPPEGAPLPSRYRQMRVDREDRAVGLLPRLAAAGLALGLVALLGAVSRTSPETVLLPFPWEQAGRDAFVRNQRESLFDKVAGATKTAFLRDGRFPDRLGQLRDSGLLSPADLQDPRGEPLLYTAHEDSYTLQATERGRPLADAEASESIAGNFYLDPSLAQSSAKAGPAVVLLD